MADVAARVKQLMMEKGITQSQLAQRAGCAQSTLSVALRSGRITKKLADKLAVALETTSLYLLYGVKTLPYLFADSEDQPIPLDGVIVQLHDASGAPAAVVFRRAGRAAADAATHVEWDPDASELPQDLPPVLDTFQVIGGSMAPVLWEGQWVCPDWRRWPKNGDLAVVVLKDGRQLVKRYWEDQQGTITLQSVRPLSPDRAEMPEPDIKLSRSKIRRAGRVRIHVLY